jgi:spermidine/putrescine transport system ATP-binding protein
MQDGKVIQCAAPEEIYEKPDEAFVAGFIGVSNLMEGVVDGKDSVKLATGKKVSAPLPDGCNRGDTVQLSVRPEKIALDDLEKGMVSLDGTIEARVYQGVNTQVTVSLGNGASIVALEQNTYRARSDDRWEPGTKVKVGWHPEHALLLR